MLWHHERLFSPAAADERHCLGDPWYAFDAATDRRLLWPGAPVRTPGYGRFTAVILAFAINYACYFSEIYRGGIESIPKGQIEAGQALGLNSRQIFFHILLVQVIKRIIPSMGNEIITLVKDTSLARVIAVYEIMWMGQAFIKSDGLIWPMFYTGAFYLLFSGLLTLLFQKLEQKMDYYKD